MSPASFIEPPLWETPVIHPGRNKAFLVGEGMGMGTPLDFFERLCYLLSMKEKVIRTICIKLDVEGNASLIRSL
jgi:hypothetical protein